MTSDVDRQRDGAAGDEGADVAEVAHRAAGGAGAVAERRLDRRLEDRAAEARGDAAAEDDEDAVAQVVEGGLEDEHDGDDQRQRHQRVHAAAGDHPVVDLVGVERQRQVHHVDEEADEGGRAGALQQVAHRLPELRGGGGSRSPSRQACPARRAGRAAPLEQPLEELGVPGARTRAAVVGGSMPACSRSQSARSRIARGHRLGEALGVAGAEMQPVDAVAHLLGHAADVAGDDRAAVEEALLDHDRRVLPPGRGDDGPVDLAHQRRAGRRSCRSP